MFFLGGVEFPIRSYLEVYLEASAPITRTQPEEAISDDFLFPMTSRLSYASSPESDLDLACPSEGRALGPEDRRLMRASSDPSVATQEDAFAAPPQQPQPAPPPYSSASPGSSTVLLRAPRPVSPFSLTSVPPPTRLLPALRSLPVAIDQGLATFLLQRAKSPRNRDRVRWLKSWGGGDDRLSNINDRKYSELLCPVLHAVSCETLRVQFPPSSFSRACSSHFSIQRPDKLKAVSPVAVCNDGLSDLC